MSNNWLRVLPEQTALHLCGINLGFTVLACSTLQDVEFKSPDVNHSKINLNAHTEFELIP